jgi:hypothetical protein
MKNQPSTSAERTQPTTPQPERHGPSARARQLRTGVRAGDGVTLPKLDSPSKDSG